MALGVAPRRSPWRGSAPHQASPCRGAPHNKGKKYPYFRKKASFEQNSGILWPYFSAGAPKRAFLPLPDRNKAIFYPYLFKPSPITGNKVIFYRYFSRAGAAKVARGIHSRCVLATWSRGARRLRSGAFKASARAPLCSPVPLLATCGAFAPLRTKKQPPRPSRWGLLQSFSSAPKAPGVVLALGFSPRPCSFGRRCGSPPVHPTRS